MTDSSSRVNRPMKILLISSLGVLGGIGSQTFVIADELGVINDIAGLIFLIGIWGFGVATLVLTGFLRDALSPIQKVISRD